MNLRSNYLRKRAVCFRCAQPQMRCRMGWLKRPFGYKCCWLALRCPSPEEAAAWGVDPLFREKTYPPGVGLVCAARI